MKIFNAAVKIPQNA